MAPSPLRFRVAPALVGVVLAACAVLPAGAFADPVMLVAAPTLNHPLYGKTVIVATSVGAQRHVGFIVNRPLKVTLAGIFPDHPPSHKVEKPVFLGGASHAGGVFALLASATPPGGGCIEMAPGLFAVVHRDTLDRVIEANPRRARYFRGMVVWRAGQLSRELGAGAWYAIPVDPKVALRDPRGLWEELVARHASPGAGLHRVHHLR
jgi:putative AlgH/UPF0301 family transcriptional regulator